MRYPQKFQYSKCRSCGAPVIWAESSSENNSKKIILDAEPVKVAGSYVFNLEGKAQLLGRGEVNFARERGEEIFNSHFATCPDRGKWRKGTAK